MMTRSCKFAQICNFTLQIRWWHRLLAYYDFWLLGHPGVKWGSKWEKIAHLPTDNDQNLQICTDMLFHMRNSMVTSNYDTLQLLTLFGAPQGSNGWQNRQKLPMSLHIMTSTCKFWQICYFTWEIRWWLPFLIYYNFWPIFGHSSRQKQGSKWS